VNLTRQCDNLDSACQFCIHAVRARSTEFLILNGIWFGEKIALEAGVTKLSQATERRLTPRLKTRLTSHLA